MCISVAQQPFRFDHLRGSLIKDTSRDGGSDHQPLPHQPRGEAKTTIGIDKDAKDAVTYQSWSGI